MYATHCTINDLHQALVLVNKKYSSNIRFKDNPSTTRNSISFRLATILSWDAGSAMSANQPDKCTQIKWYPIL